MSLNKVILIGNLGKDPELNTTANQTLVCKISLATTDSVKKGDNWEKETEWHRVVFFGKKAEALNKYTQKGSKIYVEGRIKTNKWTDNDGNDRYSTEIIGSNFVFLDKRQQEDF